MQHTEQLKTKLHEDLMAFIIEFEVNNKCTIAHITYDDQEQQGNSYLLEFELVDKT